MLKRMLVFSLGFAVLLGVTAVHSKDYPVRSITVVVPVGPGASTDLTIRSVGEKLSKKYGQSIVVENKPGAGGEIGVASVVRSTSDGYTLLNVSSGPISVMGNFRKIAYDASVDLVPVAMMAKVPTAIAVRNDLPIKNIKDLIEYSKKSPNGLTYGHSGAGTHMHLAGEVLKRMSGANITGVPYKGAAATVLGLMTGELEIGIADLTTLLPPDRDGKIRILALIDSSRTSLAPDIPTVAESGLPGFGLNAWMGTFAPRGTPVAVINQLNSDINAALVLSDVRNRFTTAGLEPWPITPEEMAEFLKKDSAQWRELISKYKIEVN